MTKSYALILIDRTIDIYARIQHTGLQEAMKDMCGVFDLVYEPPQGWKLNGVSSFSITLIGQRVDVSLEFSRHNPEDSSVIEKDRKDYVIELANFAERVYLCRILSGINVNMPVHRNRQLDFVFTYDGKELAISKPGE